MPDDKNQRPPHELRLLEMAKSDAQLAVLMPNPDLILPPDLSYQAFIEALTTTYAARPAIGERDYEIHLDPGTGRMVRAYQPSFSTISYGDLNNRIKRIAATWGKPGEHQVDPGDFICMLGFTGADYATLDLACSYAQAVAVPLQSTLSGVDLDGIFADTAPVAVAATMRDLVLAAQLAGRHASIRSVIAFDYEPRDDDDREAFEAARAELAGNGAAARLTTIDDLIAASAASDWVPLPPHLDGVDRMALLIHSSGSTGHPKGVITTERVAKSMWAKSSVPVISVALAPLNHFAGRGHIYRALASGGTSYVTAKPDLSLLFEDYRIVRPTQISMLPRVLDIVHRHYLNEVIRRGGEGDEALVREQVMNEMRTAYLGDRFVYMTYGSAPTTSEVRQFVADCFHVSMVDNYGQTEAGGIMTSNGRVLRPRISDYKLRDVPALGYYTTDKPYPRGELCIKSPMVTPGYFKRPEATANIFDSEGFLLTGDVMEERGPDHVVYIDRVNDVLKLSQGEFVALGALTATIEGASPLIQQIHLHGDSARPFLVGVIVPNMEAASARLGETRDESALRALLRAELKDVARTHQLRSFEVPRDFVIEYHPFSHENGLLTSVLKRRRPALKERYGDQLEALYAALERRQNDELVALRDSADLTVLQKVGKALEATLGIEDVDVNQPFNFGDLGGDSLGAVGFAALLEEIFGVDIPINSIVSPAGNALSWARAIEAALGGGVVALSAADVHGTDATVLNADDLNIAAFMDLDEINAPPMLPAARPLRVLLTGATGFLGRFLCLEWLERVAERGGKLICLVRAADEATARQRLAEQFSGTDPVLERHFARLAAACLEVLVSDVAEPMLGLDGPTFGRLAREVNHIVHCGALVNHVLPYPDLFGPNVVGTAELIRLALTAQQKSFDFISTVGVFGHLETDAPVSETTPLKKSLPVEERYAFGYGASKWASENLLREANSRFGLPVNIFRCDMILANLKYRGQINLPDVFTRLLYSVVTTQLAPNSFYERAPDGSAQSAHYDGLPVDFIAASIATIGDQPPQRDVRVFHVLNHHHEAGISFDTFAAWIEEAGYSIERVDNYGAWLERFECKLRALPEEKRQRSSLPVLMSLRKPLRVRHDHPDNSAFVSAVEQLMGKKVPKLDHHFLLKCLEDLAHLGLIDPPRSPSEAVRRAVTEIWVGQFL